MIVSPLPELTPVLKQLRLSGLLDSLDTRNREAIQSKLTYPEFLALVIQDEAERRDIGCEHRAGQRRYREKQRTDHDQILTKA